MHTSEQWTKIRQLIWDDSECVLLAHKTNITKPVVEAASLLVQPEQQYCCPNSFKAGTSRSKANVERYHTWVVEHDNTSIDEQRLLWERTTLPHTIRVFSGNKSIHCWIRLNEDITYEKWLEIAKLLACRFPDADRSVLNDPSKLVRTPGGMRDDNKQKQSVEHVGSRISLKDLELWLNAGGEHSTENREQRAECKEQRRKSSPLPLLCKHAEMDEARERFATEQPALSKFYKQLIEWKWPAEPGKRNERLCAMVPFLFNAVGREVAFKLLEHDYRANSIAFNDPLEQHLKEADNIWENMNNEYLQKLSPVERIKYEELNSDRKKTAFRIFRSLAMEQNGEERKHPIGFLTIPRHHFGVRMDCNVSKIHDMLPQFIAAGIIKQTKRGKPHRTIADGQFKQGKASMYQWLLIEAPELALTPDSLIQERPSQ